MAPLAADWNTIGTIVAAVAAVVAAVAALSNLALSWRREGRRVTVFGRYRDHPIVSDGRLVDFDTLIDLYVTNNGHRPVSVVAMGLTLSIDDRRVPEEEGAAKTPLPCVLADGESTVMTFSERHLPGWPDTDILNGYAVTGVGSEVVGQILKTLPPKPPRRTLWRELRGKR